MPSGERQQERTCKRVMGEGSTHWYCGARIVEAEPTALESPLVKRNPETGVPRRYVCEAGHEQPPEVMSA